MREGEGSRDGTRGDEGGGHQGGLRIREAESREKRRKLSLACRMIWLSLFVVVVVFFW